MTFRNVGCLRSMWCVLFLRMCGCRTLASRAHLGCIDVAKLPSRQGWVSRPANPHFYLRSSSVEDLPQYSVAQQLVDICSRVFVVSPLGMNPGPVRCSTTSGGHCHGCCVLDEWRILTSRSHPTSWTRAVCKLHSLSLIVWMCACVAQVRLRSTPQADRYLSI